MAAAAGPTRPLRRDLRPCRGPARSTGRIPEGRRSRGSMTSAADPDRSQSGRLRHDRTRGFRLRPPHRRHRDRDPHVVRGGPRSRTTHASADVAGKPLPALLQLQPTCRRPDGRPAVQSGGPRARGRLGLAERRTDRRGRLRTRPRECGRRRDGARRRRPHAPPRSGHATGGAPGVAGPRAGHPAVPRRRPGAEPSDAAGHRRRRARGAP